jgi:N-acetylmuramoyl-L-alanine amidase
MSVNLSTRVVGAVDVTPGQIFARCYSGSNQPKYDQDTVRKICERIVHWSGEFGSVTSLNAAQIIHETGGFRYGGQVKPEQWNFAGIGATNDGAAGATFPDLDAGVLAYFCHWALYVYGAPEQWPEHLRQHADRAIRLEPVRSAGFLNVITFVGDWTNGRWAWSPQFPAGSLDNGYAHAQVRIANEILAMPTDNPATSAGVRPLRIALAAGHYNTDGGNPVEISLVGKHCNEAVKAFRAAGCDVRCVTPDDGLSNFPGGLQTVGRRVVEWSNAGWTADVFIEFHTEGNNSGDHGRGVFVIYPDTDNDVDVDVRDGLGASIANRVSGNLGIPVRGNGLMSERRTWVGSQGFRLGVLLTTAPIRTTTTRLLIESGAHSSNADLQVLRDPQSPVKIARGVVDAVLEHYRRPRAEWSDVGTATILEQERRDPVTGVLIGGGFRKWYEKLEQRVGAPEALLMIGHFLTDEFTDPETGVTVQYTERARLEHHPGAFPDGFDVLLGHVGREAMELRDEIRRLRADPTV